MDPEAYASAEAYAHTAVAVALRRGLLAAPTACVVCHRAEGDLPARRRCPARRVVYHHWSARPEHALSVFACCRSCHSRIHLGLIVEPFTGRRYASPEDWLQPFDLPAGVVIAPTLRAWRPAPQAPDRLAPFLNLLGAVPDLKVSVKAGVTVPEVARRRKLLGIPAFVKGGPIADLTPEPVRVIGTPRPSNAELGRRRRALAATA
jgi:hypothetical protein